MSLCSLVRKRVITKNGKRLERMMTGVVKGLDGNILHTAWSATRDYIIDWFT